MAERLPRDPQAARERIFLTERSVKTARTNRVALASAPWDPFPVEALLAVARSGAAPWETPDIPTTVVRVARREDGSTAGAPFEIVDTTFLAPELPRRGERTLVCVPSSAHARVWTRAGAGAVSRDPASAAPVLVLLPREVRRVADRTFARAIFHDMTVGTIRGDPTRAVRAEFFWDLVAGARTGDREAVTAHFPFRTVLVAPSVWDASPEPRLCAGDGAGVEECPVCLEAAPDGLTLDCGHRACARCLHRWAATTRGRGVTCPVCRAPSPLRGGAPPPAGPGVVRFGARGAGAVPAGSAQLFRPRPGARALVLATPPTPVERMFLLAAMPLARVHEAYDAGAPRSPGRTIFWR